jgi:hypothetical protein
VVYWNLLAQSPSGTSPAGLMTIFLPFRFRGSTPPPPNLERQVPVFISPPEQHNPDTPSGTGTKSKSQNQSSLMTDRQSVSLP